MPPLETPVFGDPDNPDWSALYRARGEEVNANRPIFTGDVIAVDDIGLVIVLQHPCALRKNGVDFVDRLLVAEVEKSSAPPSDWHTNFKKIFLPHLIDGEHYAANLVQLNVLSPQQLMTGSRIASLSQVGVNVVLQRWVFHNSRAAVPLWQYQEATGAEFEEADLTEDWCDGAAAKGVELAVALDAAHEWLRGDSPNGISWQELLRDPAARSTVRSNMRKAQRLLS